MIDGNLTLPFGYMYAIAGLTVINLIGVYLPETSSK
jgi:hypothetical protein